MRTRDAKTCNSLWGAALTAIVLATAVSFGTADAKAQNCQNGACVPMWYWNPFPECRRIYVPNATPVPQQQWRPAQPQPQQPAPVAQSPVQSNPVQTIVRPPTTMSDDCKIAIRELTLKVQQANGNVESMQREFAMVRKALEQIAVDAREARLIAQRAEELGLGNKSQLAVLNSRAAEYEKQLREVTLLAQRGGDSASASMSQAQISQLISEQVTQAVKDASGNIQFDLRVDPNTGKYEVEQRK